MAREFTHHQDGGRVRADGLRSIFCRQCGREIMRAVNPLIRTISKCKICEMKEAGIENPEDVVLTQYYLSNDMNKMPTPIDADMSQEGGILILYPDEEQTGDKTPYVGGLFGAVKSLFRVFGFEVKKEEPTVSRDVAKRKRTGGLYDDRIR
jgi:hypothetical protein